jgi:hypothetical protein
MINETAMNPGHELPPPESSPTLTVDGVVYAYEELGELAQMLSSDYIRTEQDWQELQHRLRQFVAMESTMVDILKREVEQAGLEPVVSGSEAGSSDQPLLTIDSQSYDATTLPERVQMHVDDLIRNNQERSQLEYRLRQLDAARLGYLSRIRDELSSSGAERLDPQLPSL